ncbi:MAG: hypothetical protein JST48_11185 [Bacteroidetes bacterium]|nr:hypothetical protein [Bacteroidota bacterium]
MISRFLFNPILQYPAIGFVLLLFLWFAYLEIKRKQKYLTLRIVVLAFAMISVLGILLRPSHKSVKNISEIILLTRGYDSKKVDSLLSRHPQLQVLRTTSAADFQKSELLKNWNDLIDKNISFVVGEGIPPFVLDLLPGNHFAFIPCTAPVGITELVISKEVIVHRKSSIRGAFNSSAATVLKLIGPGGVEDSVRLKNGHHEFNFSLNPKTEGQFVYSIVAQSQNDTIVEKLPVDILPERKLRVLFLFNSPTAEIRFLKNYLSAKNHSVAVRFQTSKNNFTYEFANLIPAEIRNLSSTLLNTFDLVVTDEKTFSSFNSAEQSILKNAVRDGLGILLAASDFNQPAVKRFFFTDPIHLKTDTVHLELGKKKYVFNVGFSSMADRPNLESIIRIKNRIVSGYVFSGSGKIGFQQLRESYRMLLEDNEEGYGLAWTDLIERTARKKTVPFKIEIKAQFPFYEDEPLTVDIISSGLQPALMVDSYTVPLTEHVWVDDFYSGKIWNGKTGWHKLKLTTDSLQKNYFVFKESEWHALRVSRQIIENQRMQKTEDTYTSLLESSWRPIPQIIFYIVFLLAFGCLWLLSKING